MSNSIIGKTTGIEFSEETKKLEYFYLLNTFNSDQLHNIVIEFGEYILNDNNIKKLNALKEYEIDSLLNFQTSNFGEKKDYKDFLYNSLLKIHFCPKVF